MCGIEPDAGRRSPGRPDDAPAIVTTLLSAYNAACLSLMISLGHRVGLFDRLGEMDWADAEGIAAKAGLSERYVREWLYAMVMGGIVEHEPAQDAGGLDRQGRFRLPKEHAAFLTRAATPNNLASAAQWIGVLGAVESEVASAFRHGRGVAYAAYGARFHEVMAEESAQTTLAGLDEHIIPLVPGLADRLNAGIDVVDVGCGRGLAMVHLAARFPASRFTGIDLSPDAIAEGEREARRRGLSNVTLRAADVTDFGTPGAFDLVTAFDAIHDQARPGPVLANIRRVLRPGGTFLMQDIKASSLLHENHGHPLGVFTYTISCMHCMSVSLAGGRAGARRGVGASTGRADARRGRVRSRERARAPARSHQLVLRVPGLRSRFETPV